MNDVLYLYNSQRNNHIQIYTSEMLYINFLSQFFMSPARNLNINYKNFKNSVLISY